MDGNYFPTTSFEEKQAGKIIVGIQSRTWVWVGHKLKNEKSQEKGTNWIPILKGVGAENREERGRQQFRMML
jgi:hypothetical protein